MSIVSLFVYAQEESLPMEEEVYFEHIKSVKFHHADLPTSFPVIDLNSSGRLKLSFDDMEGGTKDYTYDIIHCDKNWVRTNIDQMLYLEGFPQEDITQFSFSAQTIHDYTHYNLIIPNNLTSWKLSGNYILQIMDEDNDNELIITKRFLVLDTKVIVEADVLQPFNNAHYNTHQRVDFNINLDKLYVSDPMNEISVTILQNNRWDATINNIKPLTALSGSLNFNKFNTSSFEGGKEFRYLDFRNIETNSDRVLAIELNRNSVELYLKPDKKREHRNYIFYNEGNGTFVPNYMGSLRNGKVTSEYANVHFQLESDHPIYDHDVYVIGEFTSWKLYPENQLHYDNDDQMYRANILLKQGYYDYLYATINDKNEIGYQFTEGDSFETENDYTLLVYYSKVGERYDQLVGINMVNSVKKSSDSNR